MTQKIIEANFHRNEFENDTFQDAIIYTYTFNQAVATKITNAGLTTFGLSAGCASTATQLSFDSLAGNLPWSSYSKFANTEPRTTSPSIPVGSMPKAGSVSIYELGVGTEVMYYGSVTWTPTLIPGMLPATTGTLNNLKRGATPLTFTGAATGTFINVIPVREKITIWNRTIAMLYVGNSQAIATTPTNAVRIPFNTQYSVWLEPLQELWILPSAAGLINIAEYR